MLNDGVALIWPLVDGRICQTDNAAARQAGVTDLFGVRLDIGNEQFALGRMAWRDRPALFDFTPGVVIRGLSISPLRLSLAPTVQAAPRWI